MKITPLNRQPVSFRQEFDLIIYNASGKKLRILDQMNINPEEEKLAPGQLKCTSQLPKLSPGTYTVHAYFYGAN